MKLLPLLVVTLVAGHLASANAKPRAAKVTTSRHSVIGMLSMRAGAPARFVVNPTHRGRYTLHIENADMVEKLVKKTNFSGLVRVEMDLRGKPPLEEPSSVKILKIERVHLRRVPVYDAEFKAVARGNG